MTSISDLEAIKLFAALRQQDFSHRSEKSFRGCEFRAEMICRYLWRRGIPTDKIWIRATSPQGTKNYVHLPAVASANSEEKTAEYNFHVAPIFATNSERVLVADTFFYQDPPELTQYAQDIQALNPDRELDLLITSSSVYTFRDALNGGNVHSGNLFQRAWKAAGINFDLAFYRIIGHDAPVQTMRAKWVSESEHNPALVKDAP